MKTTTTTTKRIRREIGTRLRRFALDPTESTPIKRFRIFSRNRPLTCISKVDHLRRSSSASWRKMKCPERAQQSRRRNTVTLSAIVLDFVDLNYFRSDLPAPLLLLSKRSLIPLSVCLFVYLSRHSRPHSLNPTC